MLYVTSQVKNFIEAHGVATYPEEGCGLLLGAVDGDCIMVTAVHPAVNRWPVAEERPERFQIDAADMLQAELAAAAQGLDVVGVFHSHPDHPPVASPRDLAWAAWPGYAYLITEVRNGQPLQSRSWQLLPDRSGFIEEPVIISDNGPTR